MTSCSLDQLLQIKQVTLVNQTQPRRSPMMNQMGSRYAVSGPNSLTNSHIHQKYDSDVLDYPSYGRNKETLDNSYDSDPKNAFPNFKLSNSALCNYIIERLKGYNWNFVDKQAGGKNQRLEEGRVESIVEQEILSARGEDVATLHNSRPTSQSYNRQFRASAQRIHDTEQGFDYKIPDIYIFT